METRVIFELFTPFKSYIILVKEGKGFPALIRCFAILPSIFDCISSHATVFVGSSLKFGLLIGWA